MDRKDLDEAKRMKIKEVTRDPLVRGPGSNTRFHSSPTGGGF